MSFDASTRLRLLDTFGQYKPERDGNVYPMEEHPRRIEELQRDEQDRLRLLDLWTFQKREIEEARLQPGEDERLKTEKRVLANAEKIHSAAMNAFDLLYEGNASTQRRCAQRKNISNNWQRYEPKFQEAASALESARISVEDVGARLRDYAGGIEASPEHLAEVEDRLAPWTGSSENTDRH